MGRLLGCGLNGYRVKGKGGKNVGIQIDARNINAIIVLRKGIKNK